MAKQEELEEMARKIVREELEIDHKDRLHQEANDRMLDRMLDRIRERDYQKKRNYQKR